GVGFPVQGDEEQGQPRQGPRPTGKPADLSQDPDRVRPTDSKPRHVGQGPRDGFDLTSHFLSYTQVHRKVRPQDPESQWSRHTVRASSLASGRVTHCLHYRYALNSDGRISGFIPFKLRANLETPADRE